MAVGRALPRTQAVPNIPQPHLHYTPSLPPDTDQKIQKIYGWGMHSISSSILNRMAGAFLNSSMRMEVESSPGGLREVMHPCRYIHIIH